MDEDGKVIGYKNLDQLRETLRPVLLRRTRESVRLELPPRTDEQLGLHNSFLQIVSQIVRKPFISEMDLLRLRQALLMCRLSADSTFLVNKQKPAFSSKLERLAELFDQLFEEPDRKVVLFSEWTGMLDLIEPLLKARKLPFVRLDGSVPQGRRAELVQEFQTNADCKLFLTTNAGSTGLNLQTLMLKRDLALAALDAESDVNEIQMTSNSDDLKRRLEILLGAKADAPVDESQTLDRAAEIATATASPSLHSIRWPTPSRGCYPSAMRAESEIMWADFAEIGQAGTRFRRKRATPRQATTFA